MVIGDRYFIDNPESGLYEVTKEEYERYNKMMLEAWEQCKSKLDSDAFKGKVIIVGTSGDFDGNQDYANIFYNPEWFDRGTDRYLNDYFRPKLKDDEEK